MSSGIIPIVKQAAIDAWSASKPVELTYGKVISTNPIKVQISDLLTLGKNQVTVNGSVENGDRVVVIRQQGGQKYVALGSRTVTVDNTDYSDSGGESEDKKNSDNGFRWPLAIAGSIRSRFGKRTNPVTRKKQNHTGIDIAAPKGTAVYASKGGKVTATSYSKTGYGKSITIDHGNRYTSKYAHLNTIDVKKGATVSKGKKIGTVDSTGRSTGNHLHFEIRRNGVAQNPLNYTNSSKR